MSSTTVSSTSWPGNVAQRVNVKGWVFVLAFTVLLEVVVRLGILTQYFPPPTEIARALVATIVSGELSLEIGATLLAFAQGLGLAAVAAVFIGLLMGTSQTFYNAVKILVEVLRPISAVALIPLAILLFGLGFSMRIPVVFYAAFWPMLFNVFYGVRGVDPLIVDTARNFGLNRRQILWRVVFPSALPSVVTGFRVSAAIALIVTISVELIAGNSGVGYYVARMEQANRLPELYAGIMFAGILGYVFNLLFLAIERRILFWSTSHRSEVI